jgi:MFS family permease
MTIGWKAFKPHRWIAIAVFLWGFVSTIQATVTSWAGLMTCRVFLGIVEACYGPGVPLYLSYFYPREKLGFRTGIFLSGSALANAYGGALAYGIAQAKGSVAPWRILFIVEGVPTCLLAFLAWWWFPDSPTDARFLNDREREIAIALSLRQPGDRDSTGLSGKQLLGALKDPRCTFEVYTMRTPHTWSNFTQVTCQDCVTLAATCASHHYRSSFRPLFQKWERLPQYNRTA